MIEIKCLNRDNIETSLWYDDCGHHILDNEMITIYPHGSTIRDHECRIENVYSDGVVGYSSTIIQQAITHCMNHNDDPNLINMLDHLCYNEPTIDFNKIYHDYDQLTVNDNWKIGTFIGALIVMFGVLPQQMTIIDKELIIPQPIWNELANR